MDACVSVCMYVSLYVDGVFCDCGSCGREQMYINACKSCELVDVTGKV